MTDVILSGNCFRDKVYVLDSFLSEDQNHDCVASYVSLGGVFNLRRALIRRDIDVRTRTTVGDDLAGRGILDLYPDDPIVVKEGTTSSSVIICNRAGGTRTSIVDWGVGREYVPLLEECRWHHVSYLDCLNGMDEWAMSSISRSSETVSVDVCRAVRTPGETRRLASLMRHVDVLMGTDEELAPILGEMDRTDVEIPLIVAHGEREITATAPGGSFSLPLAKEPGLDVLGAGDIFASHLIARMLLSPLVDAAALEEIHQRTLADLRARNE